MENHSATQTMILSIKTSCCEKCPKKLKKKLFKMQGVESVSIDTEKDLLYVTGTINSATLLNNVAKVGSAVLLQPTDEHNHRRNNDFAARKTGKIHKNCCCEDGRHAFKKKVEEEHISETCDYPTVNQRVCRDMFCDIHEFLHKIKEKVPPEKSSPFGIGWMPFFGGVGPYGGGYGRGSNPYWMSYGNRPRPFGYATQPRVGPQYPFGFQYRQ